MTQRQGGLSVERMCRLAGVNRAGFYRHWQQTAPREEEMELRDLIQRRALAHRQYGYRRITALLRREGRLVNKKRVQRLMQEDNLLCLRRAAYVPATTDSRHAWPIYPNLAGRLRPTGPDQLWVADITYVRLGEGFVYLAVVLDAWSRRVIGWALADHLRAELALEALERALASRRVEAGLLVHHSDRGVQYACRRYTGRLEGVGIQPSMSRLGCPYDNAMAERFMRTLKQEEVDGRAYASIEEARASIEHFIDTVYNGQRLHSALAYQTPVEFEENPQPPGPAGRPVPVAEPAGTL